MADTLDNVTLTKNTWVDLYAATSIAVGTRILIQNIGSTPLKLHTSASEPASNAGYVLLSSMQAMANETGDSGCWVKSDYTDGQVNVQDISS